MKRNDWFAVKTFGHLCRKAQQAAKAGYARAWMAEGISPTPSTCSAGSSCNTSDGSTLGAVASGGARRRRTPISTAKVVST